MASGCILAFLTAIEQAVLASRIALEQLVLVSKDNSGTDGLGIKSCLRADSFGFYDRFGCLGLILAEYYTQFPDGSPPTGHLWLLWWSADPQRLCWHLPQSSIASTRGVMFQVLEMAAIGEKLVGMSSREVSAALALA